MPKHNTVDGSSNLKRRSERKQTSQLATVPENVAQEHSKESPQAPSTVSSGGTPPAKKPTPEAGEEQQMAVDAAGQVEAAPAARGQPAVSYASIVAA